jgi:hypothetical protein
MPRSVFLVEFSDLLGYAQEIGFHWNQAHDILVKDDVPPMYETNKREFYFSELVSSTGVDREDPYGFKDETVRILVGFMVKENIKEFTLVND